MQSGGVGEEGEERDEEEDWGSHWFLTCFVERVAAVCREPHPLTPSPQCREGEEKDVPPLHEVERGLGGEVPHLGDGAT